MTQEFEDLVARSKHIRPLRRLEGHTDEVRSVAFSPDGHWLATGSYDRTVRLWEVSTGRLMSILEGHTNWINSVAFSPDGHWLASGSGDNTVRLWEVSTGRCSSTLQGHKSPAWSVAFSPDGRWLASGSYDHTIRLWEVSTSSLVSTFQGHTDAVCSVTFSLNGRWLASGSYDKTVRLWEVSTSSLVSTLQEHRSWVLSVAFSPDGCWLASGSCDNTVCLWEMPTGRLASTLQGHMGHVSSIAFSPDGRVLVSSSVGDGTMRFLETGSHRLIGTLSQASTSLYIMTPLAVSSDGCLLVTYPPDTTHAIQLWDISALDVGPKHTNTPSEKPVIIHTYEMQTLLHTQMRTFPLCHVQSTDVAPTRFTSWLRGAAATGWSLPLALAHDLGLLLSQPADQLTLVKPTYLPFDEDTSAYLACLQRLATHPLVRDLPSWSPPLSDAVLSVLLARLVEGLDLSQDYHLPSGPDGVRLLQALSHELAHTDPATLWQQTPPDARPSWRRLLTSAALTRLERNVQTLEREELRFLAQYGAPLAGTPDPRTLLDLLALTGLPASARLALSQTLRLLPQVSENANHRLGGIQTYPEGGYEGLARQGSLESLLPGENAYPDDLFLHRVLNHEALYYGRERPREPGRELAYLVGQLGWGLGGDGQVLVRALLLALGQAMGKLGYEVFYSLAGVSLSEPHAFSKPAEIGRLLYAQEPGSINSEVVLQGALEQLRAWREDYRRRQVLWVLSEDFDGDDAQAHASLYQALQAEGEQQVWYVRVGPVASQSYSAQSPPVTASYFGRWQVMESGCLWKNEQASLAQVQVAMRPEEVKKPTLVPFPVEQLRLCRTLTGHTSYTWSTAIHPNRLTLVSGSWDHTIKIWELSTGKEIRTLSGHTHYVESVAISPNGLILVSGSADNTIKVWELSTGKEIRTLSGHTNQVRSVKISPDGLTLVSGSEDNTIKIWELSTGKEIRTLSGHVGWVTSVAISPNGLILASGSADNTIKVWELSTGKEIRALSGHTHYVQSVEISPDGQTLVSGSADKTIKVWELSTGKEIRTLSGHTDGVLCVAISPDGQIIVSGSCDDTIKIWDLLTGKEVRTLTGHTGNVWSVVISLDGQTMASGSQDGTIKVWGV